MEDNIKQIKDIIALHEILKSQEMEGLTDLQIVDSACNAAEERLQSGKPGKQLEQNLRKLLRLVDSLDD